jgi:ABC-2 type transport system permease protein
VPGEAAGAVRRVVAVARHQAVLLRRSPGQVVVIPVMALTLAALAQPLMVRVATAGCTTDAAATGTASAHAVVGMLVFCSMFMTGVVGAATMNERVWGTADRVRSTPVRPLEVLGGKALPLVGVLLVQQAVVLTVGSLLYPNGLGAHWPRLVAVGTAWSACVLGLGALLSAIARGYAQLSTAKDLTTLVLAGTGGAIVPVDVLPGWLAPVSRFSPAHWAVGGYLGTSPATAVLVLTAAAALTLTIAARVETTRAAA